MASVSRESQTHWTSAVGVLSIALHASLTVTSEEDSILVLKGSHWPEKRSDLLMVQSMREAGLRLTVGGSAVPSAHRTPASSRSLPSLPPWSIN